MFNYFRALSAGSYAGGVTMILGAQGLKLEPECYPHLPKFFHNARQSKLSTQQCAGLLKAIIDGADESNPDKTRMIEARNVNIDFMIKNWQEKITNFNFVRG